MVVNSRSCLNGSVSKWRSVTSGIPSGLVSELVLFNVITGDMDSGIVCTFSKVPENTELHGVVTMMEGWDAIQRDYANLVKFNKAECKALHLDWGNSKHKYRLGRKWIDSDSEENDLKVLLTRSPVQPRGTVSCSGEYRLVGATPEKGYKDEHGAGAPLL